jgi:hypothetical protein
LNSIHFFCSFHQFFCFGICFWVANSRSSARSRPSSHNHGPGY